MKQLKLFGVVFLAVIAFGIISCATTGKEAAVEVEPTLEELQMQEMEELRRMEEEELEAMREEEAALEEVRLMDFDPATVLETVYFDFDKYNLRPETRAALSKNAEWIKGYPDTIIQIEGHCDERGTEEYNLALGEKRAASAKAYLVSLGVDGSRIYTISYGEERPVEPGHNETAWSKNRRAQFKVTVR